MNHPQETSRPIADRNAFIDETDSFNKQTSIEPAERAKQLEMEMKQKPKTKVGKTVKVASKVVRME